MRRDRADTRILFTLTVIVGCLSGLAAVAFHLSIDFISRHLLEPALAAPQLERIALVVALLAGTGLVVGLALQTLTPFARGSGIPEVKTAYLFGPGPQLSIGTGVGKFFLGALSIGAGFSLGREGPTVQLCACIGAAVGKVARRPSRVVKTLISVGSAAGIAAAFNTPIAAITFALEEIIGDLNQRLVGAIVVAAVAAAVIERAILGAHPVLTVPEYSLGSWWELFIYALLGVLTGVVATVFVRGLLALRLAVRDWTGCPGWAKPAVGGLAMATIGLIVPQTLGIGYATLSDTLLGHVSLPRMAMLSAAKLLATVTSYGWGLSGGIFSPALFIGATLGGSVGFGVQHLAPGRVDAIGSFALVGMGAFFAGAIRAPITSILIIFEMTGDYAIILPLMIANVISYTVAARLHPVPIYEALLHQDGIPIPDHETHHDLRALSVEQAMTPAPVAARASDRVDDTAARLDAEGLRALPVLDQDGHLVGVVSRVDLARAPRPDTSVLDVATREVVTLFPDQALDLALLKMGRHAVRQAPVVSRTESGLVVGMLSLKDISTSIA